MVSNLQASGVPARGTGYVQTLSVVLAHCFALLTIDVQETRANGVVLVPLPYQYADVRNGLSSQGAFYSPVVLEHAIVGQEVPSLRAVAEQAGLASKNTGIERDDVVERDQFGISVAPERGAIPYLLPDTVSTGKISSAKLVLNKDSTILGYAVFYQRTSISPMVVLVAAQVTDAAGVANPEATSRTDLILEVRSDIPEYEGTKIDCSTTGAVFNPYGFPNGGVVTSSFTTNPDAAGSFFSNTISAAKLKLYTNPNSINGKTLVLRSKTAGELACGTIVEA